MLVELLNELLQPASPIRTVRLRNPFVSPDRPDDRAVILDVAAGDVILFDLTRPDGKRLVRELTLDKPWATYRQSFGNDRTGPRLLAGAWIARITKFRGEKVLDEVAIATEVTAGR